MLERDHEEKGITKSRQDFLVTLARYPQRNPFPDRNEPNARHFLVFSGLVYIRGNPSTMQIRERFSGSLAARLSFGINVRKELNHDPIICDFRISPYVRGTSDDSRRPRHVRWAIARRNGQSRSLDGGAGTEYRQRRQFRGNRQHRSGRLFGAFSAWKRERVRRGQSFRDVHRSGRCRRRRPTAKFGQASRWCSKIHPPARPGKYARQRSSVPDDPRFFGAAASRGEESRKTPGTYEYPLRILATRDDQGDDGESDRHIKGRGCRPAPSPFGRAIGAPGARRGRGKK